MKTIPYENKKNMKDILINQEARHGLPDDYTFSFGKAFVFHIGSDVNIIAAGITVNIAKKLMN